MEVIIILAPFTIILAIVFLALFLKSNNSDQFTNLDSESYKILIEDTKYINKKGKTDE